MPDLPKPELHQQVPFSLLTYCKRLEEQTKRLKDRLAAATLPKKSPALIPSHEWWRAINIPSKSWRSAAELRTRLEYLEQRLERLNDYTEPEQSLETEKQDDDPLGSITGLYALFAAPVVATTVDAFDRLPDLWFDLVVVEEASQLWLIKLLKVLTKVIRARGGEPLPPALVLSGDPQQLPPFLETYESGAEYMDLNSRPLQVNGAEKVAEIQTPEKFETPFAMICRRHSERVITLTTQHRMHSEIAMLVNSLFYSDQQWASSREDQSDGVRWINTASRRPQPEYEMGGTSRYNHTEIQIINQLVRRRLVLQRDFL